MPPLFDWVKGDSPQVPLLWGAVLLYISARAAVNALAGKRGLSPGGRAVAHWIPIAVTTLAAVFCRRGDLAMAIIFSTSIASLSLVLGSIALAEPEADAPAEWRRVWPFILPATLLALLAGFSGHVTWIHALVFLIEGIVLLAAWRECSPMPIGAETLVPSDAAPYHEPRPGYHRINLFLSIALAIDGAIAALYGSIRIAERVPGNSAGIIVVVILGPLLVASMVFGGAGLARRHQAWAATTTGVGVVLLNLCLLLPAVALLWYPVSAFHVDPSHWFNIKYWHVESFFNIQPLMYSMIVWRVDTVVLIVLGFVLLPVALGRWRLGRAEGFVLIALYAVYILMETAAGARV